MGISVVILTFNSEKTIGLTLECAGMISDDIHVVDSFSSDKTPEIAERKNVKLVRHSFQNYGSQRNWAIANLPLKYSWQLHLDADERLSDGLVRELNSLKESFPPDIDGYYVPRLVYFMGKCIRHGGMYPIWHMRLFRSGKGRCEDRLYDQHFFVNGTTSKLSHPMIDDMRMSLSEWVTRHNRWADAEVMELAASKTSGRIQADISGNPVQQKRYLRSLYDRAPLFIRAFLLFIYRFFIRAGFLDGIEGLIFFVLQAFWFRFLVDAKLYEKRKKDLPPYYPIRRK